jgi:uncharacterized protein YebE (UPF0316 family)
MLYDIINSEFFSFVILPILIFFARILDQSVGIMRLIFAAKGYRKLVFFMSAFESFIWLVAISQIMKHLDNVFCYIAFPLGFATGNFVGIYLEEKISMGMVVIRLIPNKNTDCLIVDLREKGYGVTAVKAEGKNGEVKMVFTTIRRKDTKAVIEIINQHNPTAFYTIEEVRTVSEGYFRQKEKNTIFSFFNPFRRREGK